MIHLKNTVTTHLRLKLTSMLLSMIWNTVMPQAAWTFFFGGGSNQGTTVETRAAGFHGTSIWNMATVTAGAKVGAGGIIRSVALGGNIAGLASDTNFWLTTELGALYITKTPWLGAGYSDSTLIQAHTNPNDPTSDIKRDFTFRGFQYFDQHGSIGAADDGHIYQACY